MSAVVLSDLDLGTQVRTSHCLLEQAIKIVPVTSLANITMQNEADSHVLDAVLPEEHSTFHSNAAFQGHSPGHNYGEVAPNPGMYWNM
eukprot:CAMPEP_0196722790 /NCGR_PEP_ID=MMETSP1091-20130531/5047_1 /TAXON_ID=302021 /ORGANISM="Rhodomonas sp., Strain CCMP768" /LENGTH=87 /DNA_ID=CAMNT_0042064565 /DNA_START=84 /DNA_END=347 /DNA_ORIENTATION=+